MDWLAAKIKDFVEKSIPLWRLKTALYRKNNTWIKVNVNVMRINSPFIVCPIYIGTLSPVHDKKAVQSNPWIFLKKYFFSAIRGNE